MGLFDFLKIMKAEINDVNTVPTEQKQYYREDEYYQNIVHEGTPFEREVILFEDRKVSSIASNNGLYVPEILLLHFCNKYPNPKAGYPAYWWFNYGIRNVGYVLETLEKRGFIELNEKTGKYKLTLLGEEEQKENEYVYFMHKNSKDITFTAWEMNKKLGVGDKSKYIKIYEKRELKNKKDIEKENIAHMEYLKENDELGYLKLKDSKEQYEAIIKATQKYKQDKDLDWIISFWENIWQNGGLKNRGATLAFTLPDLYIKAKRYDDALEIVDKISKIDAFYNDKALEYIDKINERIIKEDYGKIKP